MAIAVRLRTGQGTGGRVADWLRSWEGAIVVVVGVGVLNTTDELGSSWGGNAENGGEESGSDHIDW